MPISLCVYILSKYATFFAHTKVHKIHVSIATIKMPALQPPKGGFSGGSARLVSTEAFKTQLITASS